MVSVKVTGRCQYSDVYVANQLVNSKSTQKSRRFSLPGCEKADFKAQMIIE
jgi:hypothetical protein